MTGLALGVGYGLLMSTGAGARSCGPDAAAPRRRAAAVDGGRDDRPRRADRRHRADRRADRSPTADRADARSSPRSASACCSARRSPSAPPSSSMPAAARRCSATALEALQLPARRASLARAWDWLSPARQLGHPRTPSPSARSRPRCWSRSRSRCWPQDRAAVGVSYCPPDDAGARRPSSASRTVMGPGWPTPYNIVVVSKNQPITDSGAARADRHASRRTLAQATSASTRSSARARSWPRARTSRRCPRS